MKSLQSCTLVLTLLVCLSSASAQEPDAAAPALPEAPAPVTPEAPAAPEAELTESPPAPAPAPEPAAAPEQPETPAAVLQVAPPVPVYPGPTAEASYPQPASAISPSDYRRNRGIAIAGKVLTVVAAALFIPYAVALDNAEEASDVAGLAAAWYLIGAAGRLTWAGADLRMTNMMRDRGANIGRGPAIASMVFAGASLIPYLNLVGTPGTWIAGSIASGNIRAARDDLGVAQVSLTPPTAQGVRGFSTGVTLRF